MQILIVIGIIFAIVKIIEFFSSSTKTNPPVSRSPDLPPTELKPFPRHGYSGVRSKASVPRKVLHAIESFPAGLEQDEDFMKVFRYLEDSKDHVFITGKAGTGKSTLLRYFQTKTKKKVVVVAPTGIAAINVAGQTIHSFFKFPHHLIEKKDIRRLRDLDQKLVAKLDTVIIDEVSMVRADLLDGIDYALRVNRDKPQTPFGGVQMVFFGDLFQLPPVVDQEMGEVFGARYANPYFFEAKILSQVQFRHLELKKIYRQSEPEFIALLNKIRNDECQEADLEWLNGRLKTGAEDKQDHSVTLTPTNAAATRINELKLAQLPSKEYSYEAKVSGDFDNKKIIAEYILKIKKGAQVIMIKNDRDKRWVNGTLAIIHDLGNDSIRVDIDGSICDVQREKWEKIKYVYNEEEDSIEKQVVGTFEQYPIKLAWALTIHKSQGQTFDSVNIDLGNGAFAHGQLYVALSRCRTFGGITLKRPVIFSDIIFDKRIMQYENRFAVVDLGSIKPEQSAPVSLKSEVIEARLDNGKVVWHCVKCQRSCEDAMPSGDYSLIHRCLQCNVQYELGCAMGKPKISLVEN